MDFEKMEITNQQTDVVEDTQEQERKENISVVDFKMVTFSLSGKDYAIDIMSVKEIAKAGRFTYVPNTLPFVLGVYNLRGDIIPILDLRLFFNIEMPERIDNRLENLIILTVGEQTFGVVVDKIDKVVGVQKSTIQPPHPLFGDINIKYIFGVVEANKHLYILLDISRIFNFKIIAEEQSRKKLKPAFMKQIMHAIPSVQMSSAANTTVTAQTEALNSAVVSDKKQEDEEFETNLKFIVESLKNYKKFYVTPLNNAWIRKRFIEWIDKRGKDKTQLQSDGDAEEFLKPFWSACSGTWWTQEYADAFYKLLPDSTAKQIFVWNPGCGKGMETYSLACVLKRRYSDAKIKIYAQDVDLLDVSNAPLLTVPDQISSGWLKPFLTKKADGENTFTQDIKNSIMFEYHDCMNANALPLIDIIFVRDVLSLFEATAQTAVLSDFEEKLKGNGILILGENEIISDNSGFMEHTVGTLTAYNKQ
jgi:chemotaxis signal transduction protein/chemotaxis methyl-accepting protein methylase